MVAVLGDAAAVEDEDAVGGDHGGQAVGDDDDGAVAGQFGDGVGDGRLVLLPAPDGPTTAVKLPAGIIVSMPFVLGRNPGC
ncbi:hypothetical protein AB0C27_28555 [Nonomuraea sp. NPDC048882]|uniref:hypothetical protein n=1 Tax=unclassified Nonomuraea TaxID=2593643 RepID=UPI0033E4B844